MTRVLFVCLGNICRSPAAQGVFHDLVEKAGAPIQTDSAGTSDWHIGKPPYGPMVDTAAARGVDLTPLRARQFRASDFAEFDLIIAMDLQNRRDMENLRPAENQTPIHLFLDYAPDAALSEVPDPYYTRDFDTALDLIETASQGLLTKLVRATGTDP